MSTARAIVSAAISRSRSATVDADRPRPAASDAWMAPPVSTDPTYSDTAAAAAWAAKIVEQGRARREKPGDDNDDGTTGNRRQP